VRTVRFGIIGGGLMGREFASAAARWLHLADLDVRPEIVHVHSESCFDLAALAATRLSSVEGIVRTVHSNFDFSGALRLRRRARVRLARRRLGMVWVACSDEVALTERTYESRAPEVVENWADVERIGREATPAAGREIRRRLGIPQDASVAALICSSGVRK